MCAVFLTHEKKLVFLLDLGKEQKKKRTQIIMHFDVSCCDVSTANFVNCGWRCLKYLNFWIGVLFLCSNLWRTTSEEKREQERLEKPLYNEIRQAAEVHRQVNSLPYSALSSQTGGSFQLFRGFSMRFLSL
jgi:hypothetical protein